MSKPIAVIIGSSRPSRITPGLALWIRDELSKDSALTYELLDLAEVNLPFLDETYMAALGQYEHEHTRAWSEKILTYSGFLFVFPQYNWGYPAVLKNALDFLYEEWANKPVSFATFGTRGGTRAAEQFKTVLMGLHMKELSEHLEIMITKENLDDNWQLLDVDEVLSPYKDQLRRLDLEFLTALSDSSV